MSFKQFGGLTNNKNSNFITTNKLNAKSIYTDELEIGNGNIDMTSNDINNVNTIDFSNKLNNKDSLGRITTTGNMFFIEGGDTNISGNLGIIRFSKWKEGGRVIDIDTENSVLNASGVRIVSTNYNDIDAQIKQNEDFKLDLSGGTMTGNIDMSDNTITNVADPSNNSDVATKQYVDSSVSDKRLKDNIKPLENSIDKIENLNSVEFTYKSEPDIKRFGFIAQEVEEIYPELISENNEGYKRIRLLDLISPLLESVKNLNKRVKELEKAL